MTKNDAVRLVAGKLAGQLQGGTFAEATGYEEDAELSAADTDRLTWAIDHVTRRLYRMGGTR